MEEGDLFVVLDGLAHLGIGSRDADAIDAFRDFCVNVPGGLEHFLEQARTYRDSQPELLFRFVWDTDVMAHLVSRCPLADDFSWYIDRLRSDAEVRNYVEHRNSA
jgi:hypothetical protein